MPTQPPGRGPPRSPRGRARSSAPSIRSSSAGVEWAAKRRGRPVGRRRAEAFVRRARQGRRAAAASACRRLRAPPKRRGPAKLRPRRAKPLVELLEVGGEARCVESDQPGSNRDTGVQGDDAAGERAPAGLPRSRTCAGGRRAPRAPGIASRSPGDTCTPLRPAAPCRGAGRSGRTRARRTGASCAARPGDLENRRSGRRAGDDPSQLDEAGFEVGRQFRIRTRRSPRRSSRPRTRGGGCRQAHPLDLRILLETGAVEHALREVEPRPSPPARRWAMARSPVPHAASSTRSPGWTTDCAVDPPPALVEAGGHRGGSSGRRPAQCGRTSGGAPSGGSGRCSPRIYGWRARTSEQGPGTHCYGGPRTRDRSSRAPAPPRPHSAE